MYRRNRERWRVALLGCFCCFALETTCGDAVAYEKEIRAVAATIGESMGKAGRKSVAVVDFTDLQGNVTELGRFLAEELSAALAAAGRDFEVVDRTHLKTILAEHKLAATGIIDPATARKLGQIAGVEALVTGTITAFGESVRLVAKGLDTLTAKILVAATTDIPKTKAVEELLGKDIEAAASSGRASGGMPAAGPGQGSKDTTPGRSFVAQAGYLTMELISCRAKGEIVSCGFRLMSTRGANGYIGERPFSSHFGRAIGDDGNEYSINRARVGSSDAGAFSLIPNVPINGEIAVGGVPGFVKSFSAIIIILWIPSAGPPYQMILRDVPVLR